MPLHSDDVTASLDLHRQCPLASAVPTREIARYAIALAHEGVPPLSLAPFSTAENFTFQFLSAEQTSNGTSLLVSIGQGKGARGLGSEGLIELRGHSTGLAAVWCRLSYASDHNGGQAGKLKIKGLSKE